MMLIRAAAAVCVFVIVTSQYGVLCQSDPIYLSQMHRHPPRPQCRNILSNLTVGRWRERSGASYRSAGNLGEFAAEMNRERSRLDAERAGFWQRKGFPQNSYSSTRYCGHYRFQRASPTGYKVGTWCDPAGPRPCCTNKYWGVCVPASRGYCSCRSCVDSRQYDYAALREWTPRDARCSWRKYTREEACDVIEMSRYDDIYYVGDSFTRDMYLAMLMILTDRPITGAWRKNMTDAEISLCSDSAFNNWKDCRKLTNSFDEMMFQGELCAGRNTTFRAFMRGYYNTRFAADFLELVRSKVGQPGTMVIVSVGFHERFRADRVIIQYLEPAVDLIRRFYRRRPTNERRWPQILYSTPMRNGLLKITDHLRLQSDGALNIFELNMRRYCRRNNIEVLDFQELGKFVHSYDGVHYDIPVNVMKNQILLNYIASTYEN